MALPTPPAFALADIPSTWEDRGGTFIDPVSTSTKAKPSAFIVKDVCGADAYVKGGHSISIAKLVNCSPVLIASVSVRATFALGTTETNQKALIDYVRDELSAALVAKDPTP